MKLKESEEEEDLEEEAEEEEEAAEAEEPEAVVAETDNGYIVWYAQPGIVQCGLGADQITPIEGQPPLQCRCLHGAVPGQRREVVQREQH